MLGSISTYFVFDRHTNLSNSLRAIYLVQQKKRSRQNGQSLRITHIKILNVIELESSTLPYLIAKLCDKLLETSHMWSSKAMKVAI